jgi:RNA polymerase-binding transcription factor DksA
MTHTEVEAFRRQLLALRERLDGDVSHLTDEALHTAGDQAGSNLSHVPLHMADLGTDNYERENTLRLLANEGRLLQEITSALERIDKGTFGRCEECGGPIVPRERLKELPYTRYCVTCAQERDRKRT